jgi:2-dehydro-3-deoxyphosphogluconate aldolase/(4S)-4-hydroxy-2-oxoglutarate aldolase
MNPLPSEDISRRLYREGIVAVLILEQETDAVPLARALVAGGVTAMELTLRTPVALDALRRIRQEVPEMLAGAGTVLTPEQVREVTAAGAAFGVAPGMNARVVAEANAQGLPFAPGVCTPSDVERALEAGCRLLKFFPAEPSGGLAFLRSMGAPFAHLGVGYLPLGGVTRANLAEYLSEPLVTAVGGSWLAPAHRVRNGDWERITEIARAARETVNAIRNGGAA